MNRQNIHKTLYFVLLLLLAASLPLSIYTTSLVQILLLINWMAEGNFREKWERIRSEKALWVFALFYGVHLAGMIWSTDWVYGLKDLKIKLSIFVLPVIIVSSGIPARTRLRYILLVFIGANIIASLASVMALLNWLPVEIDDFRDASLFISHIRFSLMIVMAIAFAAYLLVAHRHINSGAVTGLLIAALAWLPVFLIILRSLSGIIILLVLTVVIAFVLVRKMKAPVIRLSLTLLILLIPVGTLLYLGYAVNRFYSVEEISREEIDRETTEGNPYLNIPHRKEIENGNYVWLHISRKELKREWNRRSDIPWDGQTEEGTGIQMTLIRYLTSKGLRKDAQGMGQLDSTDIRAIEEGIANHLYREKFKLYPRIYELIWEIDRFRLGYSPNEKSMVQRLFYLRAGWTIARENPWKGVGTGDVGQAFASYYENNDSPLKPSRRRRAHNQYLTLMLTFGVFGAVICIASLVTPISMKNRGSSFMVLVLILTMALSMLNEDTLETTAGAVPFAFFYALFIFGPDWPWRRLNEDREEGVKT